MMKSMSFAARYFFSCPSNHVVRVPPEMPRGAGISKETSFGSSEMTAVLPWTKEYTPGRCALSGPLSGSVKRASSPP